MSNGTTASTIQLLPDAEPYREFAYISYLILTLIAFVFYAMFLKAFVTNYKQHFAKHPFYALSMHLVACDIGYLLENLIICVPYSFARTPVFAEPLNYILCAGNTLFFFSITACSLMIAVNRVSHFVARPLYVRLFTGGALRVVCASIWLFGFAIIAVSTLGGCPKVFNARRYHFLYRCAADRSPVQLALMRGMFLIPTFVGAVIVVAYAALFVYVHLHHREVAAALTSSQQKQRERQERRMLLQGALIGGSLVVENLCFNYFPKWFVGDPLAPIMMNWSGILNSMLTPVIFMLFNSVIRRSLFRSVGVQVEPTMVSQSTRPTAKT